MSDTAALTVEPMQPGAHVEALDMIFRAFGWPSRPAETDEMIGRGLEPGRMLITRDPTLAEPVVGTAGAYSLQMTMPGGAPAPVAGVTMVAVAPTHRRRGVLSTMMRRQLAELAAGGEATAALWASEPAIYQRYGYGLAAWRQRLNVDLIRSAFTPRAQALVAGSPARLSRVTMPSALAQLQAVHAGALAARPGMLTRTDHRWEQLLRGRDATPPEIVLATGPDGPLGYAVYRLTDRQGELIPSGEVTVQEVSAVDAASYAVLWRYLLDLDLMTTLTAGLRPLPDPLAHLMSDHRNMRATVGDALWMRIVDLPRALGERAFAGGLDHVLEVTDAVVPANAGRWRVRAVAGDAATATRTDDAPDLSLDVADLGAAHLGGTTLADLALAGRVVEHTPGTLATASCAWQWSPAPSCPEIF